MGARPVRLLDLYCGIGGASMGYALAGFDVVGVDVTHRERYPFDQITADALDVLRTPSFLTAFDVIHASPPCPLHSSITKPEHRARHPDYLTPTRAALIAWGGAYVIENVPGAPLRDPVLLCGAAYGLGTMCQDGIYRTLKRHRLFESNMPLMSGGCACGTGEIVGVYGGGGGDAHRVSDGTRRGYYARAQEKRRAMRIGWTTNRQDINNAIPPAYTADLGAQLLELDELKART